MSDMQSYDDQIAEIRRKAITTAAGWAPKPDSVRSGDWIGELEAALSHLMKAQNDLAKTQSPLWLESVPIGVARRLVSETTSYRLAQRRHRIGAGPFAYRQAERLT